MISKRYIIPIPGTTTEQIVTVETDTEIAQTQMALAVTGIGGRPASRPSPSTKDAEK